MKKYGLLVFVSLFTLVAIAQNQGRHRAEKAPGKQMQKSERPMISPEKHAERMAKELQLTEAQKQKVQALMEKQQAKMKQHREEMKKQREEQGKRFDDERKAHDEELKSILGAEKFEKLQATRIEHLQKMNRRIGNRVKHRQHQAECGKEKAHKHGECIDAEQKK